MLIYSAGDWFSVYLVVSIYLEATFNTIPIARSMIPIRIVKYPFPVQSGLRYINDDVGPIMDLLWRRKIVPKTIVITPIIDEIFPIEQYDLTCEI